MSNRVWTIEGNNVKRHGIIIAVILRFQQGGPNDGKPYGHGWRWKRDTEPRRFGLKSDADVLKDVMYFHRYNPPTLTMHFKSGRKISYW